MTDSLTVFGTDFTGVAGIKATGTGNGTLTYIRPQGTKSISANGTGIDVTEYASVDVSVSGGSDVFEVTLTLNMQTFEWEPNKTFAEISAAYSAGKTIIVSAMQDDAPTPTCCEFYENAEYFSYNVSWFDYNELVATGNWFYTDYYTLNSSGLTLDQRDASTYPPELETVTKSYTPTESQQTETITPGDIIPGIPYDGISEVNITVGAISSSYVGSGITRRSSSDLTASGDTVTVPAGYYSAQASKAVASGTAGTPSATKGSVSNHAISVTPSVTNTTGYITGSTKTGTAVTVSASELVSGSQTITNNNTYDVTNLASVVVNVAGGVGTLLTTYSMGTISTSSTQAADTGKSISVSGVNNYDLLIVETSVNTVTNNRHTATVGLIFLTASSAVATKNGATVATVKWNSKISSSAVTTTRAGTTAYGIYPNSCSVATSNNVTTATIPMYQRYNSTSTGTINGNYTARVYGVNLYDLIGG